WVVLFGGWSSGEGPHDDTWEWDGTDWIPRDSSVRPSKRDAMALANVGGDRLVMYGGGTDTWEWDGNTWLPRKPVDAPTQRKYLAAATLQGDPILFGGSTGQPTTSIYYSETWRWHMSNWQRLLPGLGP